MSPALAPTRLVGESEDQARGEAAMGNQRGNNGGERPQEGDGLPDLPPEWGTIIIPEHPGELDDEGAALRRVFRREARRRRWRRRFHLRIRPLQRVDEDSPGLAVPLLIMTVAVVATLTSLFAVAWPGQRPKPIVPQTPRSPAALSIADIGMVDGSGTRLPVRELAPAVILIVDGCSCEQVIADTINAVDAARPGTTSSATTGTVTTSAPADGTTAPAVPSLTLTPTGMPDLHVSVLVVGTSVPAVPAGTAKVPVRGLADPNHSLRNAIPALAMVAGADALSTAAVLVDRTGVVVRAVPDVKSPADFADDLHKLW
jgi:hypothetical protein